MSIISETYAFFVLFWISAGNGGHKLSSYVTHVNTTKKYPFPHRVLKTHMYNVRLSTKFCRLHVDVVCVERVEFYFVSG